MFSGMTAIFIVLVLGGIEFRRPGSIGREFFVFNVPIVLAWFLAAIPNILGRVPDWWVALLGERLSSVILDELREPPRWPQDKEVAQGAIKGVIICFGLGLLLGLII